MEAGENAMGRMTGERVFGAGLPVGAVAPAPATADLAPGFVSGLGAAAAPSASPARVRLAERAMGGDVIAFERLVERWIEPAYRTALAILGSDADARDATQDALLEAWRNIRRLRDPDRFDAWLGRIHLNACRGVGRRRGRSSVREISLTVITDVDEPPSRATAIEDESTSLDELERAFDRLSDADRSILVLHHLQELPVSRIAEVLRVPEGTAKWRLHAARGALARALEEERR